MARDKFKNRGPEVNNILNFNLVREKKKLDLKFDISNNLTKIYVWALFGLISCFVFHTIKMLSTIRMQDLRF